MPALVDTRPRALFKERAGVGHKPTLTPEIASCKIRPNGRRSGTCATVPPIAITFDGASDPHRSAGVSCFWITCRPGELSGNGITLVGPRQATLPTLHGL
jgi:hypothetical protein